MSFFLSCVTQCIYYTHYSSIYIYKLIYADEASTMNEEDALIGGEFFIMCDTMYLLHTYYASNLIYIIDMQMRQVL